MKFKVFWAIGRKRRKISLSKGPNNTNFPSQCVHQVLVRDQVFPYLSRGTSFVERDPMYRFWVLIFIPWPEARPLGGWM